MLSEVARYYLRLMGAPDPPSVDCSSASLEAYAQEAFGSGVHNSDSAEDGACAPVYEHVRGRAQHMAAHTSAAAAGQP